MTLVNFVAFVVFKILENLVSMQNTLNTSNCWRKQNFKNCPAQSYFYFKFESESSTHYALFSIVLAEKNAGSFT